MEAFRFQKRDAIMTIRNSCAAIEPILSDKSIHVIRYEDCGDRPSVVAGISKAIGYPLDDDGAAKISGSLDREVIRAAIADWQTKGVIDPEVPASSYTEQTHWHPNHVGDGRIGKYSGFLTPADEIRIERGSCGLMQRFGYAVDALSASSQDTDLALADDLSLYGLCGISYPEDWGVWTDGPHAQFEFLFSPDVTAIRLHICFFLGPSLQGAEPVASGEISINGVPLMALTAFPGMTPDVIVVHDCKPTEQGKVILDFRFDGLQTPAELSINDDPRRLGVGVRRIAWSITARTSIQVGQNRPPSIRQIT